MHPFIIQFIAAERTRDIQERAQRRHEGHVAANRRLRQRRPPRTAGTMTRLPVRGLRHAAS